MSINCKIIMPYFLWRHVIPYLTVGDITGKLDCDNVFDGIMDQTEWKKCMIIYVLQIVL